MKTLKFFAYAFASLAMAFAVASCGDKEPQGPETPDTPVVKPADVVFSVKVKDVTLEKATITITHNGEKDYTWYGFCTTDVNTDLDEAIAAQIEYLKEGNVVFADVVRTGTINKDFVKDLQTNTVYRYIVFGLNEDTTTYGTPAYVDFTTDRVLAGFTATVARTTEESVKVNVVSKSGYDEDTWFAAICPASADVEEEFAAAVAAADLATALKAGDGNVTFDGLLPGTDYVVAVAGVKEDGTTYTDLVTVEATTTAVTLAVEVVDVTDELVKIAVTSSSESEAATWMAVCYPKSEGPASVVFKTKVSEANLATALKTGDAVVTFNDVAADTDYIVAVAGVTVTGKVYTAITAEEVSTPAITFTLTVDETTEDSATVTVTSSSASQSATWFATIMPETTAVETAFAAAVAAADLSTALKVGTQTITFNGLTPGAKYTVAIAGVDVAGKVYTEVVSASVIPSSVNLGFTVADHGADYITVQITSDSETATWYAFCVAEDGVSTADEYAAAAVAAETDLAAALKTGNATITYENLQPGFYEVGVVGVNADGTIYTSALAESVKVIFTWNERTDWSFTFTGVADDGTTLMEVAGVPAGQYYLPFILPAEYLEGAEIENILDMMKDDLGFTAADLATGNGQKVFEALEPGNYVAILAAADYTKVALTGDYTTSTFKISGGAEYEDFLGSWITGGYALEVSQKVAGSTYNVTGLPGMANYGIEAVEAEFVNGTFVLKEQRLPYVWYNSSYGDCWTNLSGEFSYGGNVYIYYPFNAEDDEEPGNVILTGKLSSDKETINVTAGYCDYAAFVSYCVSWSVQTGANAGKGNSGASVAIEDWTRPVANEDYNKFLGAWTVTANTKTFDITIETKVPGATYTITGWTSIPALQAYNQYTTIEAQYQDQTLILNNYQATRLNGGTCDKCNSTIQCYVTSKCDVGGELYLVGGDYPALTGSINADGSVSFEPYTGELTDGREFTVATYDIFGYCDEHVYNMAAAADYGTTPYTMVKASTSSVAKMQPAKSCKIGALDMNPYSVKMYTCPVKTKETLLMAK